jgi:cytochrome c553
MMTKPIARRLSILVVGLSLIVPALAADERQPAAAAKPDVARGQAISTQVCAACHTNDGSRGSPANPILQGQIPEYLVKQLSDFKSGERTSAVMKAFASGLSEADMKNVAAF